MLKNKKIIIPALVSSCALLLGGCYRDDRINAQLSEMTKVANFIGHEESSYEIRIQFKNLNYRKIDAVNDVVPLIRDNPPIEMDYQAYIEQSGKRIVDDINLIEIKCITEKSYTFVLLSDWISCHISIEIGEKLGSYSSDRYYSIDKTIGEKIRDFCRDKLKND